MMTDFGVAKFGVGTVHVHSVPHVMLRGAHVMHFVNRGLTYRATLLKSEQ